MAFGQKGAKQNEISQSAGHQTHHQTQNQPSQEDFIDLEDEVMEENGSKGSSKKNMKPLYDEVTILDTAKSKNAGGTKRWRCNYCKKTCSSSYTRIHHHFFGAPVGVKAEIARCPIMISNRDLLRQIRKKVEEAEEAGISPSLTRSTINSKTAVATNMSPLDKSFRNLERHEVDMAVVRFLCANGIPFNVLRSPEMHAMTNALKNAPKDYKHPSYDRARTSLLDDCRRDVEKQCIPISETWTRQGTSIVSDGWSNIKNKPLINVIASNSRGSMFLYAEVFSGVEKSGKTIADFLLKAIDEIGPSNVIQVITDNAANCKAAGREIEKVHKHIFWSPCVVHTLNLMFKDFAATFPWMESTYTRGKAIVKYFKNHDRAHDIFRNHSGLELLKVAKTRFGSHFILLRRLSKCREALATTIVVRAWKEWIKSGDERAREVGMEVAATIANEEFWDEVDNILAITKPLYYMIKFSDGEGQKMGEIYEKMDCMIGEIGDVMNHNKHHADYEKMKEIMIKRWEKMNLPMHCLGFALNPFYYDVNYLKSPAPGGESRRAPNCDREVVQGVLDAFDRVGEDQEEKRVFRRQLSKFQGKEGIFGTLAARIDAQSMDPISWWSTYGAETPELSNIALKVLSQPISSSSAERVWSTYSYIHNVKRNRLNSMRADKLVYVHSNIRLISRFTKSYKDGPYRKWDVDPETSYLDDSAVRLEELEGNEGQEEENSAQASKRQRYPEYF
ncbi:uncharacterized protein LOC135149511 [Daucus carota subsp. sativus]|uniref:uncharacterized protein LOC135149511 n=1 Tax=Daucus carota subsp. sativus TaxID=79200 RepID=UPI0030828DA5